MEIINGQISVYDILKENGYRKKRYCKFPMICGRNKYVCCSDCNKICVNRCELDKEECGNYVSFDISDSSDPMGNI